MTCRKRHHRSPSHATQTGSAGIEFALIFTIFFAVFYAALSYAFVSLAYQSLVQAASEGARAAVQVNPLAFKSAADYETQARLVAIDAAKKALVWLPQDKINLITSASNGITAAFTTSTVSVTTAAGARNYATQAITVKVTYPGYPTNPLLPVIKLAYGTGANDELTIPAVPTDLVGSASLRVTPTFTP